MIRRMLINATQSEELRVALVSGQRLYDLDIENTEIKQTKASIFKGVITRIEASLEAAFVDYGGNRHGFLPFREISKEYYDPKALEQDRKISIKEAVREGQELIIQVDKEERGNKGAALTTYLSLAGCYLVLMPNNPRAGGISRRIEGDERSELKEILNELSVPDGMGVIVRTAGVGRDIADLRWDLSVLISQWTAISDAAKKIATPFLIHQESDLINRAIRDYLRPDINEILIDNKAVYEKACEKIKTVRPDFLERVKLYEDTIPLFNRFQIESQIESAFHREVKLPSGGAIVIDHTEALISIDINSAKSTKGTDIEETARETNLEAADEIARQLRLRDSGGLIVIDFIDMTQVKNQRLVEQRLREALSSDRARVQVGRISRFGILEMSRQRLRPALNESSQITCPRCGGEGSIRNVETLAINVLRVIEEEAIKENTLQVVAELPIEVATYLMNEKRQSVLNIETRQLVQVLLLPNPHLQTPSYNVFRVKEEGESQVPSYAMKMQNSSIDIESVVNKGNMKQPAVQAAEIKPAPIKEDTKSSPGIIRRIWSSIVGSDSNDEQQEPPKHKPRHHHNRGNFKRHNNQKRGRKKPEHGVRNGKPQSNTATNPNSRRRDNPQHKRTNNKRSNHNTKRRNYGNQNKDRARHNNNQENIDKVDNNDIVITNNEQVEKNKAQSMNVSVAEQNDKVNNSAETSNKEAS